MEITITHCRYTPRWDSLQTVVQEATNEPEGVFTRIERKDKGTDYRKPGEYAVDFRQGNGTVLPIQLTVLGVGQGRPLVV